MKCSECRFWQPDPAGAAGQCRRHPPMVVFSGAPENDVELAAIAVQSQWPETVEDEWCGEFLVRLE